MLDWYNFITCIIVATKMTVKRQKHPPKREQTRSISYRLPEFIVNELETEAMQKEVSQNVLVKQILEKYVKWDRFADKIGIIPVPKEILKILGNEMKGDEINKIIDAIDRKSTRLNSSH